MALTMPYRWLLIPAGVLGIAVGFALYARERRRCDTLGCRMAGSRVTLAYTTVAARAAARPGSRPRAFPESPAASRAGR
jgi:hypothetical protein